MKQVPRVSKGWFNFGLISLALGVSLWQGWAWWSWATAPLAATTSGRQGQAVRLQIPSGTPSQQIGHDLEAAGLIRSASAWQLWTRWLRFREPQGSFQAGTYELSAQEPMQAIAQKIWTGQVIQRSFTIPEGWSIQQMARYFESEGFFKAQDFIAATHQIPRDRYPWLPANLPHLEGFLYPDTYQLQAEGITPAQVVQQMLDRFAQVALPLYQKQAQKPALTLLDWVTLSSIVEKEAVIPAERPRIAGVFLARLAQNMTLGSDPTVEYAFGIQQTPDQPLTLAQVRTPSPYNTYLNPGLPPTPIASPGLASLEATLSPEKTEYLYFVARYDGTHVFSRTLAEHEAAQAAIQDAQAASRSTPAPAPTKP